MDSHNALQQLRKSPYQVLDPGNGGTIPFDRNFQYAGLSAASATSGAETRIQSAPNGSGREAKIGCTYYGNGNITVTVKDSAGATTGTIAFTAIAGWAKLLSVETSAGVYAWNVEGSYSVTLTTIHAASNATTLSAPTVTGGLTASGTAANDFSGSTGTFTTSLGLNTFGGNTSFQAGASVTAAGSTQGDAVAMSEGDQVLVTGVTGQTGYGVKFPSACPAGRRVIVQNITAFAAKLYPFGTENIGAGASTAVTLAASTAVLVTFSAAGVGRVWTIGAQVAS
jgi:hypothetical protein